MSILTDAQTLAVYNAEGQALPGSISQGGGSSSVVTVVSGTAFQPSATRNCHLYINITTSAALAISLGPTSAGNTIAVAASSSEALGVSTLFVPAGWYVLLTGTAADVVVTAVLT